MDGNASLKLVDRNILSGDALEDQSTPRTDMCLTPEEVDAFKDEVKRGKAIVADDTRDDIFLLDSTEIPGRSEDANICISRWKNAGPEARKKMFALFAISGIFACFCRHGHMLIMCNMVRSGEL
jgi:hypothetical protein